MIALQVISKILNTQDNSIVEDNGLTEDYFVGYENEFQYIQQHIKEYGNVPDKATFLSKFDIDLVDVTESDRYLIDTLKEEYLYYKSVPIIQQAAELLKTDSNLAAEYLLKEMQGLQPDYKYGGIDIISTAESRYKQFMDRKEHQQNWYFTTGFKELDDLMHGIQRQEELIVLFARINQGKSWVLEKICTHIWELGFNVGYISPEMSADSVGFRFDTLHKNFSNKGLMWGKGDIEEAEYKSYIDELKAHKNQFQVATPINFQKKITISKLREWVKKYSLDIIAIDGITYLSDERYTRGDSKAVTLTNISEDLMSLSVELHIPILVVVQANRGGVVDKESEDTPELENIKDSDGIGANASKVLAIKQTKDGVLIMQIKKQRFGPVNGKLQYIWNIDNGEFEFMPSDGDAEPVERTKKRIEKVRKAIEKEDVF